MDEDEIRGRLRGIEAEMKRAIAVSRVNDYRLAIWASWLIAFCLGVDAAAERERNRPRASFVAMSGSAPDLTREALCLSPPALGQ